MNTQKIFALKWEVNQNTNKNKINILTPKNYPKTEPFQHSVRLYPGESAQERKRIINGEIQIFFFLTNFKVENQL